MDLKKIGKFIAKKRQENNYTQESLAEALDISNRAISKWERGICLPDASRIPEICKLFNITINDLFSGEIVDMKNNEKKYEENMLEVAKLKQQKDKQLLLMEWGIAIVGVLALLSMVLIAGLIEMPDYARFIILGVGAVIFLIAMFFGLRIEQVAGDYKCAKCGHKYIPGYWAVFFAPHMGRTRYLKCPKCGKRSWSKKSV